MSVSLGSAGGLHCLCDVQECCVDGCRAKVRQVSSI